MAIFGSDEVSIFDTLLLYLYQTIVLVSLAAVGFIFYLFRTRAPLKDKPPPSAPNRHHQEENGVPSAPSLSDDEILLRSALLRDSPAGFLDGAEEPPPEPPGPNPQPAPRSKHHHDEEEEEEEEEEDGPTVTAGRHIRQMVTTRPGDAPGDHDRFVSADGDQPFDHQPFAIDHHQPSPGFAQVDDQLKLEAKKRIGHAIQKKQVLDWVGSGDFDEAITNIRAASQRLQNSE